jgi:2-dehydro-3-deoxyphosphogluconate aldolase/(4S)-4-hydroxy-2-oxoglutarate aldolase
MTGEYMRSDGFYEGLERTGVIPVVVLEKETDAVPMARALVAGGLPAAEVTFRTSAAPDCIHEMATKCPDILVGAGTVLNLAQAKRAVDAGAKFIVSPGYDVETLTWCLDNHVDVIPGGVTATEITALVAMGLDVTKFFPANLFGGKKGIDSLASVFVGHRFMPTGGVSLDNVEELVSDPAIIAAGGTWMVKPKLFADGDFSQVEKLTSEASAIVRKVRG